MQHDPSTPSNMHTTSVQPVPMGVEYPYPVSNHWICRMAWFCIRKHGGRGFSYVMHTFSPQCHIVVIDQYQCVIYNNHVHIFNRLCSIVMRIQLELGMRYVPGSRENTVTDGILLQSHVHTVQHSCHLHLERDEVLPLLLRTIR